MPQLGESIAEATVIEFLVNEGDLIDVGQDLLEVETNKATMNVTSPAGGTVKEWQIEIGESYAVGATLGQIEVKEDDLEPTSENRQTDSSSDKIIFTESKPEENPSKPEVKPIVAGLPVPVDGAVASYISPRLKARMHELGLRSADLAGIAGSGAGGRVTIQDFERFIADLENTKLTEASSMRVAVADAMRRSWTRPLASVGLPVILDPILIHRRTLTPKPGPTLYAIRALSIALKENSAPAGRLIGRNIAHPASIDIGFAVEVEDGVLVPVIRSASEHSLAKLTPRYQELLHDAQARRLPVEATGKSIATVTNFGTFGLTWATPIPLPEQNLVMGLGAGRKQPIWDEPTQSFLPKTEAGLTLSFDHRVLDGGAAGRLLARVAELMGKPEEL
jgi:pyruvate/2-oxoglutarate dehydrogenase complex dihydrolipoamide acyltransferase (E2) component